jgi:hypothetical protein
MEDKIEVKASGLIYLGGYLNSLEVGDRNVVGELLRYFGITGVGESKEILGDLTLTIQPLSQSLTINGKPAEKEEE